MRDVPSEHEMLMEIRDLLRLIAEPQLAARDKKWRDELRRIVGKGDKNIKAVLLMNGLHSQAAISKEVPMDQSNLSKLVRALRASDLLTAEENPELVIPINEGILKEEN